MKKTEKVYSVTDRKQITLFGFHWHNAVLDWQFRFVQHGLLYGRIEFLRFKIEYIDYGPDPF